MAARILIFPLAAATMPDAWSVNPSMLETVSDMVKEDNATKLLHFHHPQMGHDGNAHPRMSFHEFSRVLRVDWDGI